MNNQQPAKWHKTIKSIRGPLVVVDKVSTASYGELCTIRTEDGKEIPGQVLQTTEEYAVVQLFENPRGVSREAQVQFTSQPAQLAVSTDMLGRVFDGMGRPTSPGYTANEKRPLDGAAINPAARLNPDAFVQTGISTIDCMNTLVRGQKLPIFSQAGLPHNELAAQIVRQADMQGEDFVIVFAAMGITNEEANYFLEEFEKTGALERTAVFLNTASDPSVERIITPRAALTCAEYLAFEQDMQVLVVLTDFTNYCEALREVSSARGEIPGRRGYPGYMYTDLAAQYERAGIVEGSNGSITQIPIISMPSGDKTHPIPDLTGYITEGQIVLDEDLYKKGLQPPINPLPSLSRLMGAGAGEGKTREDHEDLADQLYASYAQGIELRQLVAVVGEGSLSPADQKYLRFADAFEKEFIHQTTNRGIKQTLDKGWELLKHLPRNELKKVKQEQIEQYL